MKILWICHVWPEPTSSAAGHRTEELIRILRDGGHEVTVCSPAQPNSFTAKLRDRGVHTCCQQPNDGAFNEFVRALNPTAVFFDRFMVEEQFSWRVRAECPEAIRILDTVDLHSLRRARHRDARPDEVAPLLPVKGLLHEDTHRELAAIFRSDLSLIISDAEMRLLIDHFRVPSTLLALCRCSYPVVTSVPSFAERRDIVAIGNFNHPPNLDAFRLLCIRLWPEMREALSRVGVNDAELHIVGAYPKSGSDLRTVEAERFRVVGWVDDAAQLLARYRVNLAPLRFGAGIKGKIAQGWGVGTPCVATTIASEGMHHDLPFGGVVTDKWSEYCAAVATLYTEESRWCEAQRRGREVISLLYDESVVKRSFLAAFEETISRAQARREENVIGAMLWYHQLRSSEFFSRWIEEKHRTDRSSS